MRVQFSKLFEKSVGFKFDGAPFLANIQMKLVSQKNILSLTIMIIKVLEKLFDNSFLFHKDI